MEETKHHRTPKRITVTVRENPLDTAAREYIALFSHEETDGKPASVPKKRQNAR